MRDPAAIANHPVYYGAFSNLSILFWSASAAICLFSSYLLNQLSAKAEHIRFLLAFGCFSTVLCLDDLFMLHERLFPEKLNIPESIVFIGYAAAFIVLVFRFRQRLRSTEPVFFLVSCLLFAVSIFLDVLPIQGILTKDDIYLLEDGAKILAIFFWLAYFAKISVELALMSANE